MVAWYIIVRCTKLCTEFLTGIVFQKTGKGKALPRTGHEGPEREQMYSPTVPSTSALGGGGWSKPRPGSFNPGKDPAPTV